MRAPTESPESAGVAPVRPAGAGAVRPAGAGDREEHSALPLRCPKVQPESVNGRRSVYAPGTDELMGLLQRIGDLLRSNINDLISRAEDPERMLNAAIDDMQRQLVEAKSRVAMSIADEKRLQKQADAERAKSDDWESKAMSAVRAGRDDLAMEALARKKDHENAANQFQEQLDSQKASVDELKRALSELTAKLDDTKRRRTLLLARAKRAEAQRQLADTLGNRSHTSAVERLQVLEARIEQDEARAEAQWEIAANSGQDAYERDLAAEIDMLGEGDGNQELAALKARVRELDALTPAQPRPALGDGKSSPAESRSAEGADSAPPEPELDAADVSPQTEPEPADPAEPREPWDPAGRADLDAPARDAEEPRGVPDAADEGAPTHPTEEKKTGTDGAGQNVG